MTAIPSTQVPLEYAGKRYSGVYSVSGALMIARIPGLGSRSVELDDGADTNQVAADMLQQIMQGAKQEGRL